MTWVRIDDAAVLHPKILKVGPEAAWLWVAGLAHANRHHTDGVIESAILPSLYPYDRWSRAKICRLAKLLVDVGLWLPDGENFVIHDYAEYQEEALRSSVEARKVAARERKRRQREREKEARSGPGHGVTERDASRVTARDLGRDGVRDPSRDVTRPSSATRADARAEVSQAPGPSRPVPTRLPSGEEEHPSAPAEPPGAPNLTQEIRELEARYVHGLPHETREAIALSRRNGKVADSVWLATLRKLAAYPVDVAEFALRTFCEKHADGEKTENYLVGIARQEARRRASGGARGPAASRAGYAPPAPPEAFVSTTEEDLDEIFGPPLSGGQAAAEVW